MKATILRGISGSGKSTWANQQSASVFSTDRYFMVDGIYQYDPAKLATYHNQNLRAFIEALLQQDPWVIVDNTNVFAWEYAPYVLSAQAFGYTVEIITFVCPPEVSLQRKNLVPQDQLLRSYQQLTRETELMPYRFRPMHRLVETG